MTNSEIPIGHLPVFRINRRCREPDATCDGEAAAQRAWEPVIVAFLCNWCSYAGADLAGSSRMSYPANVRVVRVPCSGRVNPMFVMQCFKRGFDGVLIAGCHPGDCHYAKGNFYARRRMPLAQDFWNTWGSSRGASGSTGSRPPRAAASPQVVSELTEAVRKLGPYAADVGPRARPPDGVRACP